MNHNSIALVALIVLLIAPFNTRLEAQEVSGWILQTSGITQTLFSVHFVDANTGWAVGNVGTILRTQDGGATWMSQTSGTTRTIYSVHFVDANSGWAVGQSGTIIHTQNGGVTWTTQTSSTTIRLYSVHFENANTGWAVGDGGTILRTQDGGATWTTQTSSTTNPLWSVHFENVNTGWAVGDGGTIQRTQNGGSTWTIQTSGTTQTLRSVHFMDANTGWAVGNGGTILCTQDGGATWTIQTSGTTQILRSVHFLDSNTGWVVGLGGTILHTQNGGETWTLQTSGTTSSINSIHFVDTNTGWAVGEIEWILKFSQIRLEHPKGGDFFGAGSSQQISWTHPGLSNLRLDYSSNNGSTWNPIADSIPASDGIYEWAVPNNPGNQFMVRISDLNNYSLAVTSSVFTVHSLALTSPKGGETWRGGEQRQISWSSQPSDAQTIGLEYSQNNGTDWVSITDSIPATAGTYTWDVPDEVTTQGKVRVYNRAIPQMYDESDAVFSITRGYVALLPDTVIVQQPSYINVMFHALDANGVGITDLGQDEFVISENVQVISDSESFKQIGKADRLDYTLQTVLVLDNSFSLSQEDLGLIKQAAITFIENKLPEQRIAIYSFSEIVTLVRDFTTDAQSLIAGINSIQRGFPSTNLYGAIITGLSRWEDSYSLTQVNQGSLVVFTDGADTQG